MQPSIVDNSLRPLRHRGVVSGGSYLSSTYAKHHEQEKSASSLIRDPGQGGVVLVRVQVHSSYLAKTWWNMCVGDWYSVKGDIKRKKPKKSSCCLGIRNDVEEVQQGERGWEEWMTS